MKWKQPVWWEVGGSSEGVCVRWFSINLSGTSGHLKPYDMVVFHALASLILNTDRLKYRELTIYIYTLMKTTSTDIEHSTKSNRCWMFIKNDRRVRKRHETTMGWASGESVAGRREKHGCKWRLIRLKIYTLPSSIHTTRTLRLRCVGFEWTTYII